MDLRHLRYFVRVAEELHFGRAATQLGISQPPLSQQIRALEDELGVALFERTSRRVRLTEAGEIFLPEARKALQQADHAAEVARRAARGEIGELALGLLSSVLFVPAVASALFRFRQAYPAIRLDLRELSLEAQLEALAEGDLDMGFVRSPEPPELSHGLMATLMLEEEMVVAMRRDHPLADRATVAVADLAEESFVLYERRLGAGFNEQLIRMCRAAGFEPRVIQESGGIATLLGLVSAGFGITFLARSLSVIHLDSLVYRPLAGNDTLSRLWMIRPIRPSLACRQLQAMFVPALAG